MSVLCRSDFHLPMNPTLLAIMIRVTVNFYARWMLFEII